MPNNRVFAAIDVGSYEIGMKIFELSKGKKLKELDCVVHRLDLGSETYSTGQISNHHMRELSGILNEFNQIMKSYGVKSYRAYGTSALREVYASEVVINLLKAETGIDIHILSNSEQRFLDYKSVAIKGGEFDSIIENPTAFVDIGGGSLQLSVFDNKKLISTQNIDLGVLRTRTSLIKLGVAPDKFKKYIFRIASAFMRDFKKLHLKSENIKNLIIVDDYISPYLCHNDIGDIKDGYAKMADYEAFLEELSRMSLHDISVKLDLPLDKIETFIISSWIVSAIAKELSAELIWAPGAALSDGIAYNYAENKRFLKFNHNFEKDIISAAENVAGRYLCDKKKYSALSSCALDIFDVIKKKQSLKDRERLLLEISAILYDCGSFVSMTNTARSAFNIIMSTEMIGLSHSERETVAYVVWMSHLKNDRDIDNVNMLHQLDAQKRLLVSKLAAILRVADSIHFFKPERIRDIKVSLKDRQLFLVSAKPHDYTLEYDMLSYKMKLFAEVYGIEPVLRYKRGKR